MAPGRLLERARRLEEALARCDQANRQEELRIADYLHDHPLQALASAAVRIYLVRSGNDPERAAHDLARAEELVREGLAGIRRLSNELRRRCALGDELPAAVHSIADRCAGTLEIDVQLEMGTACQPVDPDLSSPLTEALRNVLVEIRARGGRTARVGYAGGSGSDLVLEVSAPELAEDGARRAGLEGVLAPARRLLGPFDVEIERRGESLRFVVPAALVERPPGETPGSEASS